MRFLARRTVLVAAAALASAWLAAASGVRALEQALPNTQQTSSSAQQASSNIPTSPNTLTVENSSGDPVRAELIGPSSQVLELEDNEKRTVNVAPGEYTIQLRYGKDPKAYAYGKVAPFKIEQTGTTYMAATVTIDCNAGRSPVPIP